MSLHDELHDLFGRIQDAPWPGERHAFDQFLRRKARRGRVMAAGLTLTLAAVLAAAVLVPRLVPDDVQPVVPVAPTGRGMRIADQGFQVAAPAGWRISRKMTRPLGPMPYDGRLVEGVVLAPSTGDPSRATITVTTDAHAPGWAGASRRADGRRYLWRPGSGHGDAGQYLLQWPTYCHQNRELAITTCSRTGEARGLLVTGYAPDDAQLRRQVQQAMRQITMGMQPITNALPPPPSPTIGPQRRELLGKGGSGTTSWEAWIEPSSPGRGDAGLAIRFPKATPRPIRRWKRLELSRLNGLGTWTLLECVSGKGMVIGVARADVAMVQVELSKRPLVELPVVGSTKAPLAIFALPPLPVRALVNRATAFTADGKMIGSENLKAVAPCWGKL
jgi:hypothetical protein